MAKLIITDHADPSVGLFPGKYHVDAPIWDGDEKEDIEEFRSKMIAVYSEFATGKVTAEYDFEVSKDWEHWQ